ncbi:MAG: hypothetical protein JSS43_20080 [Proteobacteria bacterium]|nr:hypothetical protein [Pseudomonadota bacterium]
MRKSLRVWLRNLHEQMGLTSVFVTHDQAEAMEMADRIAVLRAGRIEQVDTPARLYADPASAFVHDFMGESISFACVVADGVARLDGLPDVAPIPTTCRPGAATAVIRPYEIALCPGAGSAVVRGTHVLGPMRKLLLGLGPHHCEVLVQAGAWAPAAGEQCSVDLSRARVYPAG